MPRHISTAGLIDFKALAAKSTAFQASKSNWSFKGYFGVAPLTAAILWRDLKARGPPPSVKSFHLLWALHFLKVYPTVATAVNFCKTSQHPHKAAVRVVLELIGDLNLVSKGS